MKIENYDPTKSLSLERKTSRQPAVAREFNTILEKTIENKKTEFTAPPPTAFASQLNAIQPSTFSQRNKQVALDRIENFIGLLDQYQQKLADPSISLKKIDPIINEINKERESLTPVLDALRDNEKLKNIMNQALVTATLELNKFYRGDYL